MKNQLRKFNKDKFKIFNTKLQESQDIDSSKNSLRELCIFAQSQQQSCMSAKRKPVDEDIFKKIENTKQIIQINHFLKHDINQEKNSQEAGYNKLSKNTKYRNFIKHIKQKKQDGIELYTPKTDKFVGNFFFQATRQNKKFQSCQNLFQTNSIQSNQLKKSTSASKLKCLQFIPKKTLKPNIISAKTQLKQGNTQFIVKKQNNLTETLNINVKTNQSKLPTSKSTRKLTNQQIQLIKQKHSQQLNEIQKKNASYVCVKCLRQDLLKNKMKNLMNQLIKSIQQIRQLNLKIVEQMISMKKCENQKIQQILKFSKLTDQEKQAQMQQFNSIKIATNYSKQLLDSTTNQNQKRHVSPRSRNNSNLGKIIKNITPKFQRQILNFDIEINNDKDNDKDTNIQNDNKSEINKFKYDLPQKTTNEQIKPTINFIQQMDKINK